MNIYLCPLSTDAASKLDIFRHYCNPLRVNGAQIVIFEEANEVCLCCFLQCSHCRWLKSQVHLEILSNLPYEPLEGQLSYQQLCALLVFSDFTEENSSGPEPMGLLHSTGGKCRFSGCLGRQLLLWGLTPCWFTGSLLCLGHLSFRPALIYTANSTNPEQRWMALEGTIGLFKHPETFDFSFKLQHISSLLFRESPTFLVSGVIVDCQPRYHSLERWHSLVPSLLH